MIPFKTSWLSITAIILSFYACMPRNEEPTIEGNFDKYFDYQAQTKSFRVLSASGKPYNHKIDWHIVGIKDINSDKFFTKEVDTLPNGELKISYDWVSFLVRNKKSIIDVVVLENKTGRERSVFFVTKNDGKQIFLPDMVITQKSE